MRTLLFIIQKETLQVLRDKVMLVQIFVPPVLQLLILAQAMTFEVSRTDLALVDLDGSTASAALVKRFTASERFQVSVVTASGDRADNALLAREANAVLRIPSGFERNLRRGEPAVVQMVLNAEDGAAAGVVQGYAAQILAQFSAQDGITMRPARLSAGLAPVHIKTRTLYNPQRAYLGYMAIGLLASLVTLVGILLASQNIAREKEIGTLEQLNVTPITKSQFIAGKLIPFLGLGFIELTIGLLMIGLVFQIAFAGSVTLVYLGALAYLTATLGLGLLISTMVSTQQQAQFIAFFVIVTFFFLGGIFTPIQSMPSWAQTLAEFNPTKHFVDVLRTVLMKGGGLADIGHGLLAMTGFAAVALTLALVRYRKTAS
ncbi:MAG: ABC transporter permease [Rhodothermales bacterium]